MSFGIPVIKRTRGSDFLERRGIVIETSLVERAIVPVSFVPMTGGLQ